MQKFNYKGKDAAGLTRKGIVEAIDEKNAARVLQERGLLVISLKQRPPPMFAEISDVFGRVSSKDKVNFTRQLATMMTAGLPLTDALSILETQSKPALAKVVGEISREIESGGSLAKALEKQPQVFDPVYIALVQAGEAAGVMEKVLVRQADNLEKQNEFGSKIKGAMIYPIIVILAMVAVMVIMVIFVLPKMLTVYQDFGAELPPLTKFLMFVSNFTSHFWWLIVIAVVPLFVGLMIVTKKPKFKLYYDRVVLRLPIIGKLKKNIMLTEFARTLGLLIGTGILIVEALNIVENLLGNSVYERAVKEAAVEVEKGVPLADSLARSGVFPPILSQMVAVGEETGKLDEVLGKVSSYFEQEADVAVKGLTTAIEPLIMIVLGVGVGFLVFSIIMPIYSLTSKF